MCAHHERKPLCSIERVPAQLHLLLEDLHGVEVRVRVRVRVRCRGRVRVRGRVSLLLEDLHESLVAECGRGELAVVEQELPLLIIHCGALLLGLGLGSGVRGRGRVRARVRVGVRVRVRGQGEG